MNDFVKVKDNDGLVRDTFTGAIINTNTGEYQNYLNARERALAKEQEIARHTEEINNIKGDLSEIKEMLKILTQKDK